MQRLQAERGMDSGLFDRTPSVEARLPCLKGATSPTSRQVDSVNALRHTGRQCQRCARFACR